ncbi:FtsX-like permease family protein [Parahaliea maris]|uniref:FtsX-like permease family protein n=1 Tax=Parahaliea maris TaxID=2716870 RepID=A0A5C8ZUC3_9GAMM|nr:ABC transporter permease [Parahaliea maris]TXS92056.1 FtsX-like permease family protein [Parahaliea maris]
MLINLHTATRALRQNRLQAALTLCGMSIGVAMVVIVSGLGRGAQLQIESQIESAGPTLISVRSGNFSTAAVTGNGEQDSSGGEVSQGPVDPFGLQTDPISDAAPVTPVTVRKTRHRSPAWPLTQAEVDAIASQVEDVRSVAASVAGNVSLDEQPQLRIRVARVHGFQTDWEVMSGWKVLRGRMVTAQEHAAGTPVMLVSPAVAQRLWPDQDPLLQQLSFAGQDVAVVGVVDIEDESSSIVVPTVHVPMTLAQQLLDGQSFDEINVRSRSVATTSGVAQAIRRVLREQRQLADDTFDDFRVTTQSTSSMPSLGTDPRLSRAVHANLVELEKVSWEEMAASLRQAGRTFTLLLTGAAAVSLLVGGIGVMNIMLVSVVARTREIGLRLALGARMQDIMLQFIAEAVTLAVAGGCLGLVLGYLGLLVAQQSFHWAAVLEPAMVMAALVMAMLTGIVFGYGPARRAARLDPVVALKAE